MKKINLKSLIFSKKTIVFLVLILLIALLIIGGLYFYNKNKRVEAVNQDPTLLSSDETQELVNKVGKLILLPDENPSIANIADVSKVRNQPFFSRAQDGDKVLIFPNSKKAIIYRPSENKIIEVSNVSITDEKGAAVGKQGLDPALSPGISPSPSGISPLSQ